MGVGDDPDLTLAQFAVQHSIAWATHIGRAHRVNQDAGGAWTWTRPNGVPVSLVVVADGVSSGKHSEEASRLAVTHLVACLEPLLRSASTGIDSLLDALVQSATEANALIAARPHEPAGTADATTLAAALSVGTSGAGVWCGDSRVYQLRDGAAERLTADHSWAEGVVAMGLMSADQARADPRAHMITRWLGPTANNEPGIDSFRFELVPGSAVLCCSDGLYGYFTPPHGDEQELARALIGEDQRLQTQAEALVAEALRRGGHDDISLAVIRFGP